MPEKNDYGSNQIKKLTEKNKLLENLGMYIWALDSRQHIKESVSNSIDEFMAWFCNEINLTINADNSLTVEDNWRWIPIGLKINGKSTIEEMFETIHMGGKFDQEGYVFSGWQHWIGTKIFTYVSDYLNIEVKRNWNIYTLKYKDWELLESVKIIGKTKETWTKLTFKPSWKYLTDPIIKYEYVANLLKKQHYLTTWLKYTLKQINEEWEIINKDEYFNQKGLSGYINDIVIQEDIKTIWSPININDKIIDYYHPMREKNDKLKLSIAFQYANHTKQSFSGYTNNIVQSEWWTHVAWLKELIFIAIKNSLTTSNIKIPKDSTKDDILNWTIWIVSLNIARPTLEWQTKNKLWDTFVQKIIRNDLKEEIENIFLQDIKNLEKIAKHIETNNRTRKAIENIEKVTLKKVKDPSMDPDSKLTDAESKDRKKCEIFIVEWDSAWGWIDEMRNSQYQAIYKLKGKPLNSETSEAKDIFNNKELKNLLVALWTWIGKNFDIEKLRYWKIFILSDSDVDWGHIQSLLLTFFKKYTPELLFKWKIFRIIPPLYWISTNKWEKHYLKDKKELEDYKEKHKSNNLLITRFKWLWEMNPIELYETCINSKNRIIEKITDNNFDENKEFMELIMGPSNDFKYKFLKNYQKEEVVELLKTSKKELKNIVEETMFDYGMYVNRDRAISNLEDWLKPVHKRALWAMLKMWIKSKWKTTKSARVTWETAWKYHPHWTSSIYWAISKLTQDFKLNNPIVHKQWNFWSIFWFNNVAADRYTEVKLSEFAEDLLLDWLNERKQIVEFKNNYDGILLEPEFLPSKLPMPLLIPTFWIWLGISSDIPPHNLIEVANATIAAIKNKSFTASKYIKWPDFPLDDNEIIIDQEQIKKIYEDWLGSFRYRVKLHYNEKEHSIEIKSLPYNIDFYKIYNQLIVLVKWEHTDKKWKTILLPYEKSLKKDIKKLSNNSWKAWKKNWDIVNIELKLNKCSNKNIVIAKLYKLTKLETSLPFRPVLINRKRIIQKYNLDKIIIEFVKFRKETLIKLFNSKLETLQYTKEILEAKIIANKNWKDIAILLTTSETDEDAKKELILKYNLSEYQAEHILDTKIRIFIKLNLQKVEKELDLTLLEIKKYKQLLNEDNLKEYIIDEIKVIKKKYGIKRKTKIIWKQETLNFKKSDISFENKEVNIFLSSDNLILKTSWRQIKIDNRLKHFQEAYGVKNNIIANNRNKIYIVQNWKCFNINIWDIDENSNIAKPINIYNNKIDSKSKIDLVFTKEDLDSELFVTYKDWNIARTKMKELLKSTQWYIFNKKEINSALLKNNINQNTDYLIRYNENKFLSKHSLNDIPLKTSLGWWLRYKWNTTMLVIANEKDVLQLNNSTLKITSLETSDRLKNWKLIKKLKSLKIV